MFCDFSTPTLRITIGVPSLTKFSMVTSPDSLPIGLAPLKQSLIPLYAAGLWLAVNMAPGRLSFPEAKYNISVDAKPIRMTSSPCDVTPAENAVAKVGDDGRISSPITTVPGSRSCSRKRATATPVANAKSGVSSLSTRPRMS